MNLVFGEWVLAKSAINHGVKIVDNKELASCMRLSVLYFHFKNPLIICSSASCSVSPRVISLIICSPAILPMAAS